MLETLVERQRRQIEDLETRLKECIGIKQLTITPKVTSISQEKKRKSLTIHNLISVVNRKLRKVTMIRQFDRDIEDLYYSARYETVISMVHPIWFAEINTNKPLSQAWQAIAFEVRCCYQLEKSLEAENLESPLIKFGCAYLDYLNKNNLLQTQQILSELSQSFPGILPLRASTLHCKFNINKLQSQAFLPDSEQLVKDFNNHADALEILMQNYLTVNQNDKAFEIGNRYLSALQKNGHSLLRYFEEKVRISAFLIALGNLEQTEQALADLLSQKTQITGRGRALAYFFLGNIAQLLANNTESKKTIFRQYNNEVGNRFFNLALAEDEQGQNKASKTINETIKRLLDSKFDYSTSIPRYQETKPDATNRNISKWIDYGLSMAREGNASEAGAAYLEAYHLSVEQENSGEAVKAIHYLLPEHLSLFSNDERTALFQAWEDKFGELSQFHSEPDRELRKIRLLALQYVVEEQYTRGAELLNNFLSKNHQILNNIPKDELIDTFYRLGNFSYWAGLYELSAKAWDSCYEKISESAIREPIRKLLQLDKISRFSKYVVGKTSSEAMILDESFPKLEQILNNFAISKDVRAIWLLATDISKELSQAESAQLKKLSKSHYQTFEKAYRLLRKCMGSSQDYAPFASGVARNAARVEFVGAYPKWGKLWREIIYYLRERANSGSFADRVLSFRYRARNLKIDRRLAT